MAEVLEKWAKLGQKRGHVNNQFVTCGSVPGADLIGHVVWLPEAGSCHTLPSKADGLTPNSAPNAIKFLITHHPQPRVPCQAPCKPPLRARCTRPWQVAAG